MFIRVYEGSVITQGIGGTVKYRIGFPMAAAAYALALAAGGTIQVQKLVKSEGEALRRASAHLRNLERDGVDCRVEVTQVVVDDNAFPAAWDNTVFINSGKAVPNPAQYTMTAAQMREQVIIRFDAPEQGLLKVISAANKPVAGVSGVNLANVDVSEDTEDKATALGEGA